MSYSRQGRERFKKAGPCKWSGFLFFSDVKSGWQFLAQRRGAISFCREITIHWRDWLAWPFLAQH